MYVTNLSILHRKAKLLLLTEVFNGTNFIFLALLLLYMLISCVFVDSLPVTTNIQEITGKKGLKSTFILESKNEKVNEGMPSSSLVIYRSIMSLPGNLSAPLSNLVAVEYATVYYRLLCLAN